MDIQELTRSPRRKTLGLLVGIALGASTSASAGIGDRMGDFMDSFKIDAPRVYETESAGYASFGRITAKTGTETLKPVSFTPPEMSFGCGGIDAYMGGFSMINADQIVDMAQQVGQQAVATSFYLALDSLSPQLGQLMKTMQDWANKANQFSMDSCQAAVDLNRAALGAMGQREQLCGRWQDGESNVDDAFQARFKCGSSESWDMSLLNPLDSDGQPQSGGDKVKMSLVGNVVWQAMSNLKPPAGTSLNDEEVKELLMSLLGSVIYPEGDKNSTPDPAPLPKKMSWQAFFDAGGKDDTSTFELYDCPSTDKACLNPGTKTVSADDLNVIRNRVSDALFEVDEVIGDDTNTTKTFGKDAKLVLALSDLPLFQLTQTSHDAGYPNLVPAKYEDLLVAELTYKWLAEILPPVVGSLAVDTHLPGGDMGIEARREIAERARRILDRAEKEYRTQYAAAGGITQFLELNAALKRMMAQRFTPSIAQRLEFAKALSR